MRRQVLIVDDGADVRFMLRMALECYDDLEVSGEAASGAQGVEAAAALRPDAVALDLNLGDLPWQDVAAEIRRVAPDTRIVACTAHVDATVREAVAAGGLHGCVTKDDFDGLAAALRG